MRTVADKSIFLISIADKKLNNLRCLWKDIKLYCYSVADCCYLILSIQKCMRSVALLSMEHLEQLCFACWNFVSLYLTLCFEWTVFVPFAEPNGLISSIQKSEIYISGTSRKHSIELSYGLCHCKGIYELTHLFILVLRGFNELLSWGINCNILSSLPSRRQWD